jgi:hypothetical protein
MNNRISTLTLIISITNVSLAGDDHKKHDIIVAANESGQLTVTGFDPDDEIVILPPVSGILVGWSDNEPGFDHLVRPQPNAGLFPLSVGTNISLEIISIDQAFRMIDSGFQVVDEPGAVFFLGTELLHTHPIWHIDSNDPDFDDLRTLWRVTFVLFDEGSTGYSDSEPLVMRFANVECSTGDLNDDGLANKNDYQFFQEVLEHPESATHEARCAADCDLDGLVTEDDVPACMALMGVGGAFGDFDADGDVDLIDFGQFQLCFTGPDGAAPMGCATADSDLDGDVDLIDFGAFQLVYTGAL